MWNHSHVNRDFVAVELLQYTNLLLLWSPSITDDDDLLLNVEDTTRRGRIHVLTKLKVRRGCTVPSPLTWPSTKKSDGTKEFATTDSMDGCNVLPETQFAGTRLRVDTTLVLSVGGNLPPCGAAGERSDFNIKPPLGAPLLIFSSRLSPEVFSTSVYFRKTAGVWNQSFPSPRWAAKGYRATPARMPVIPLATRSQHVDFAYDQVVRPHRSYGPSGGLPWGKPRTRHMWIYQQFSGARGVYNGGVNGNIQIYLRL